MVKVRFYVNKDMLCLRMEGHADAAPKGEDIVCAAASILVTTLADFVSLMNYRGELEKDPQIQMQPGFSSVKAKPKQKGKTKLLLAFSVITTGMSALKRNYPEHIDLKLFEQSEIMDFSIKESSTLTDSL